MASQRIRLGMIGGGDGAFIGAVHRMAARLDDRYEFVAGALSSTPEKSIASARALGLAADRGYRDFATMLRAEAARPDGVEAVAIVTPNDTHVAAATACLAAGCHVICDKPLASTLDDGLALERTARAASRIFAVTYNYTGYPMVRHARAMVAAGDLGAIRVVQVEYAQDWLSEPLEATGQKQAAWRTDPAKSGAGGAIGDIGTHAFNLAEFVSGLTVEALAADLHAMVPGRRVDDNAHMLLRFAGGARGMLWASQVAPGNENALRLRIYGTRGGLEWSQEHPNQLRWSPLGGAPQTIARGTLSANAAAARVTRVPAGHPEGYIEGFATIYREVADAIVAARTAAAPDPAVHYPGIADGVRGLRFIDAALRSSRADARWTPLSGEP